MDNIKIAKILLKIAKSLEADYEYRSDPDHKHKPKGGGWKQTKQGWSKSDNSKQKTYSNTSMADSTPTKSVKPEDYGNVNAPIRKAIKAFRESNKTLLEDIREQLKQNMDQLKQSEEKSQQELERFKQSNDWSSLSLEQQKAYIDQVEKQEKQDSITNHQNLHASNLIALGVSEEHRGKFKISFIKAETKKAKTCIEKGISAIECLVDKNMISAQDLSICTSNRQRSCYYIDDYKIKLGKKEQYDISTLAHEMGHFIEHTIPGSWSACHNFLIARTKGEESQSLQQLTGCAYRKTETAKPDHFFHPYCGAQSSDGTEILSMGIQKLAQDPLWFEEHDPEYFYFVLGILRGEFINDD